MDRYPYPWRASGFDVLASNGEVVAQCEAPEQAGRVAERANAWVGPPSSIPLPLNIAFGMLDDDTYGNVQVAYDLVRARWLGTWMFGPSAKIVGCTAVELTPENALESLFRYATNRLNKIDTLAMIVRRLCAHVPGTNIAEVALDYLQREVL